jgi:hypothetical protein
LSKAVKALPSRTNPKNTFMITGNFKIVEETGMNPSDPFEGRASGNVPTEAEIWKWPSILNATNRIRVVGMEAADDHLGGIVPDPDAHPIIINSGTLGRMLHVGG